ncbi:hypothetical protein [Roseibacillus persicicus]|uniref:Uncharacterized protein n=1 Tax=Roseibacillus persicicus TaxID=454148 RepID=A0A918TBN0_9BACT|nr:hypothetical protein [Roseibacillus persicicus]MDQ8190729.1 hypothetical protein [Roseibacillus persicicus]GHC40656.1 hypothetical protein GCM10007100_01470 [Roseibacillus persicicus]
MSPQLIIISSAMSLGGMASIGFNHYNEVEKQVATFHEEKEEEVQRVEVAEVGERVESAILDVKETFRTDLEKSNEGLKEIIRDMNTEIAVLKSRQNSHDLLMERLEREQTSLGFKIETQAESFRPLRATESRFVRVKSEGEAESHPLLPPVDSWTSDY